MFAPIESSGSQHPKVLKLKTANYGKLAIHQVLFKDTSHLRESFFVLYS